MSTGSDTGGTDAPRASQAIPPGFFPERPTDRRRRRRRLFLLVLLVMSVVVAVPVVVVVYVAHDLNGNIRRLNGMLPPETGRPEHVTGRAAEAVNVLVLGADGRAGASSSGASNISVQSAEESSDTAMIVHIDGDRRGASLISISPDTWMDVPGHGMATIGMANAWGGPALAVSTLEKLTDVRIDHVAIVGWDGYQAMIDALGGIDVTVAEATHDSDGRKTWTPVRHHFDGSDAVRYAREGSDLPAGDLKSVARREAVLRALSDSATTATSSPTTVYQLLEGLTQHLIVDSSWSATGMAKLALSMHGIGASDVSYLTIPVAGTGTVGGQSVVFVDRSLNNALWTAVREDRINDWREAHPELLAKAVVR